MRKLFGTDGMRGRAGKYPLDDGTIRKLGAALGRMVSGRAGGSEARVLIGRDTRQSGPAIETALIAGLRSAGVAGESVGVVTTPGLAYLTREGDYGAGAMISASHNPYRDNGVKVLGQDGRKLRDEMEADIERLMLEVADAEGTADAGAQAPPELLPRPDGRIEPYRTHLREAAGGPGALEGLSVVLDCSHGSASAIAPELFASLGASVRAIGCEPDGRNINEGCGSLHLDLLRRAVRREEADLGLAFDGDADRCLAVDRTGRALDGDFILYVQARAMRHAGLLRNDLVVATVMSNLWLEKALGAEGIRMVRTRVGDKYVLQRMIEENAALGGEQSGHIIFLDHLPSGDGILTGLLLAAAMRSDGVDLAGVADGITPCPQVLINVPVATKPDLDRHAAIGPALRDARRQLEGEGRVLIRYSGTEDLARVMIEGTDESLVRSLAEEIAGLIGREIGARS